MLSKQAVTAFLVHAGSYDWWHPGNAPPLHKVVNMLVNRMEHAGWSTWLGTDGPNYRLLMQLVAYSLCNVPLPRSSLLPGTWPGGDVTLEQLERDGVVQLVSIGKLCCVVLGIANDAQLCLPAALSWQNIITFSPHAIHQSNLMQPINPPTQPHAIQPHATHQVLLVLPACAGKHLAGGEQPDNIDKRVVLPPALLAAFLRRVQRPFSCNASPTLLLVQGMMEASRVREHDDLTITLLRLQMFSEVLHMQTVQLQELLPTLAGTDVGATFVKVCPDAACNTSLSCHACCQLR